MTAPGHDPLAHTPGGRPRARGLPVPFAGTPGRWNAITDVPGLELGYATRVEGESIRTGVTAIHPRGREHPDDPCAAASTHRTGTGR